ncbi:MAG TPA: DUF4402 domain-containing protein [Gemmatimonadales bacterium]
MSRLMKASVLTCVILGAVVSSATAQTATGSILAKANVLKALTVSAGGDLDFGLVVAGVNKTITPSAGGAGKFTIEGQANQAINVSFTALPATLTGAGPAIPISYTGVWNGTNDAGTGTSFSPSVGLNVANQALSGAGFMYLFLGGTVSPAAGQTPGLYQGTVTIEVAYNGY